MYYIIYQFNVKPGHEKRFVKAWSEVTEAIIEHCGGLGSRMHKSEKGEYIAYAQWPSKEHRDNAELPESIRNGIGAEMRDCCDSIDELYELNLISDLLVPIPEP